MSVLRLLSIVRAPGGSVRRYQHQRFGCILDVFIVANVVHLGPALQEVTRRRRLRGTYLEFADA